MKKRIFKFELGAPVQDTISGFEGVIMGRTEYFTGCVQYGLLKKELTKDGNIPDWIWLDEARLWQVGSYVEMVNEEVEPGGPQPAAPEC